MSAPCCTRCGKPDAQQLVLVLDGAVCRRCVVDLKRWLNRRSYLTRDVRDAQLASLVDQHGAITVLRLAQATGKTPRQAKGILYYLSSTRRVRRVGKGRYVLAESREQAAE